VSQRMPDQLGRSPDRPSRFGSLLSDAPAGETYASEPSDLTFLADLRLDQVISAAAGEREERDLVATLLRQQVSDTGTLHYRHEIFRDLEDAELFDEAKAFSARIRDVRRHLNQIKKMHSTPQQHGWFLDAVAIYCHAVSLLNAGLAARPTTSRGLAAFREYLAQYVVSAQFSTLSADAAKCRKELAGVTYLVRIKGLRVEVSRYDGEPDYSAEIEETFGRFRQAEANDYLIKYRVWPGMTHVGEQILDLVARLFADEFGGLAEFCRRHAAFLDAAIGQFERELQFYLAYLDYIRPLRSAGLSFCYPDLVADSKEVFARDTFDLALASKLIASGTAVVGNDFELRGAERIIVVSGPNQGGKTTFARTFGQLHHLARIGCPVPGAAAALYLCDRIFTHFEREEDIADLTGKLENDLIRIQEALRAATPRSIIIMNEIFTSTTLADARFLGRKVLEKVAQLDALCIYVSFIDELASFADSVVSMVSTIVPDNPAQRTYKVVRRPADGLAYALAIADKNGVTYQQLRKRVTP
jgi:DNA mismatch repair protein MutS